MARPVKTRCFPRNLYENIKAEGSKCLALQEFHLPIAKRTPFFHFHSIPPIGGDRPRLAQICHRWVSDSTFLFAGVKLEFTPEDVAILLGLPLRGLPVHLETSGYERTLKKLGFRSYYKKPFIEDIASQMREIRGDTERAEDFVKLWVMYLFCSVLFTEPGQTLPRGLIALVENLDELKNYNWPSAIHKLTIEGVHEFCQNQNGYVRGCPVLLTAWYYERLKRMNPPRKDASPRLFKWSWVVDARKQAVVDEFDLLDNNSFRSVADLTDDEAALLAHPIKWEVVVDDAPRLTWTDDSKTEQKAETPERKAETSERKAKAPQRKDDMSERKAKAPQRKAEVPQRKEKAKRPREPENEGKDFPLQVILNSKLLLKMATLQETVEELKSEVKEMKELKLEVKELKSEMVEVKSLLQKVLEGIQSRPLRSALKTPGSSRRAGFAMHPSSSKPLSPQEEAAVSSPSKKRKEPAMKKEAAKDRHPSRCSQPYHTQKVEDNMFLSTFSDPEGICRKKARTTRGKKDVHGIDKYEIKYWQEESMEQNVGSELLPRLSSEDVEANEVIMSVVEGISVSYKDDKEHGDSTTLEKSDEGMSTQDITEKDPDPLPQPDVVEGDNDKMRLMEVSTGPIPQGVPDVAEPKKEEAIVAEWTTDPTPHAVRNIAEAHQEETIVAGGNTVPIPQDVPDVAETHQEETIVSQFHKLFLMLPRQIRRKRLW